MKLTRAGRITFGLVLILASALGLVPMALQAAAFWRIECQGRHMSSWGACAWRFTVRP